MKKIFLSIVLIASITYSNALVKEVIYDHFDDSTQKAIITLSKSNSAQGDVTEEFNVCVELAADVYATAKTSGYSEEDSIEMADSVFAVCAALQLISHYL